MTRFISTAPISYTSLLHNHRLKSRLDYQFNGTLDTSKRFFTDRTPWRNRGNKFVQYTKSKLIPVAHPTLRSVFIWRHFFVLLHVRHHQCVLQAYWAMVGPNAIMYIVMTSNVKMGIGIPQNGRGRYTLELKS